MKALALSSFLFSSVCLAQADAGTERSLDDIRANFVANRLSPTVAEQLQEFERASAGLDRVAELRGGVEALEAARLRESIRRQAAAVRARSNDTKMVGPGVKPAKWDEHKYQVGLVYSASTRPRVFCGGTLVALDWVLTAAHCLVDLAPRDLVVFHGDVVLPGAGKFYAARRFVVHGGYDPAGKDVDVALIKLEAKVPTSRATVVALPLTPLTSYVDGSTVVVSGWGDLTEGAHAGSPALMTAKLQTASRAACEAAYPPGEITPRMRCAGSTTDSCQGDSGGPMVFTTDNKQYLVGAVSWGEGCGHSDSFGVYTDLTGELGAWAAAMMKKY